MFHGTLHGRVCLLFRKSPHLDQIEIKVNGSITEEQEDPKKGNRLNWSVYLTSIDCIDFQNDVMSGLYFP